MRYPLDDRLRDLLAQLCPDQTVLCAPDGFNLTGFELGVQINALWAQISELPRGTRIASLLPDAPLTAVSLLALVHHVQLLPLNPALTDKELTASLAQGHAQLLLAGEGDMRAAALADAAGIGLATLRRGAQLELPMTQAGEKDPALVLMTSGSTGTPKRVPLTPEQLHLSAGRIKRALHLGPSDCAVHALPMFHIGAIVDLLLAPLSAGGSVRFAGGMGAQALQDAVQAGGTWVQLVPTMLARLRAELDEDQAAQFGAQLRFIRSVSSDLAPHVQAEAEAVFAGTPIIQMYGMTETAGQITTNPLPPGTRKLGSVGRAFEVELRISDAEVQVRGDSVTAGYEGTERADHFTADGWLRTGDLASVDADGFVFLTGRSKEMINRGGEKISPHEVEHAALSCPDVIEAAAFSLPHPSLGEEVGLAVTLARGGDQTRLKSTLEAALAAFKRPRHILVMDPLPRLGSGKIDRRALADLHANTEHGGSGSEALSPLARQIEKAWLSVLPGKAPTAQSDFFDAGGDSLSGAQFLFEVEKLTGRSLPQNLLYEAPEFAEFADAVARAPLRQIADRADAKHVFLQSRLAQWDGAEVPGVPFMRVLGQDAPGAPLFWCAQEEGEYQKIAEAFAADRPVYLMRSLFLMLAKNDAMNDALAADYAAAICLLQPEGTLRLGGFCEGAKIMRFAAAHLRKMGREVCVLISWDQWFDTPDPVPVLHLWSDERYESYRKQSLFPEHAITTAHPGGHQVIRVGGTHTQVLTQGPFQPFVKAIQNALNGDPLPELFVTDQPFAAPIDGALHIESARFFKGGAGVNMKATVTNGGPIWPASASAPLYLSARIVNLDGHVTSAVAALTQITEPVAEGTHSFDLNVPMPSSVLPVRVEVSLYDGGSNAAQFSRASKSRKLLFPKPF